MTLKILKNIKVLFKLCCSINGWRYHSIFFSAFNYSSCLLSIKKHDLEHSIVIIMHVYKVYVKHDELSFLIGCERERGETCEVLERFSQSMFLVIKKHSSMGQSLKRRGLPTQVSVCLLFR